MNVFPPSPQIPGLLYSGQFSYTQTYTPSGSAWAPGLDEREVFFASLKHAESLNDSWEIRVGKGGQLYSIRGPFGESQAPQTQPDAHWVDEVFQLVASNRALNVNTPNHTYFIHQAGDYLRDPILTSTFYSPMLANHFDGTANSAYALNWGQHADIPNVHQAGLLYYERIKDLGSGVIEITYVTYNFGSDLIDYHNTPWGGVRKSALPVTIISNPDGSWRVIKAAFGGTNSSIDLSDTGGWIAWTRDVTDPFSPTLALVAGKDSAPRPSSQYFPARFRYGTDDAVHDFEVVETNPFVEQAAGSAVFFRVYLVVGSLAKVQSLANSLSSSADRGPLIFREDHADLVPLYLQNADGQTILTRVAPSGQKPALYTYAQPVANSQPLFVLRNMSTGQLRLSTDPCELSRSAFVGSELACTPYNGAAQYVGFLGYVLPAKDVKSKSVIYGNMLELVPDRSYFPVNNINQTLKAVIGKTRVPSVKWQRRKDP